MKHKHKWHFVKKHDVYFSMGYKDADIEIPSKWHPAKYEFVCEYGVVKVISENKKYVYKSDFVNPKTLELLETSKQTD